MSTGHTPQQRTDQTPPRARPSAVILHDLFRIKGGGERLTLSLARHCADALCFGAAGEEGFDPRSVPGVQIHDLRATGGCFGLRTLRLMHAFRFRTGFIRAYDVAIYSGILAPLAVHQRPGRRNILYCHTPPRFAYDQYRFDMQQLPRWKRPFMAAYVPLLRRLYAAAVARMDCIVVNSSTIQHRVARYLGRPSVIVHPPCDIDRFQWRGQGDYYLSTARLVPLKRIDVIVEAFRAMPDKQLVVASGGSELERLRALAGNAANIRFAGWTDEETLLALVGNCIATLYLPVEEDFGMSPVESMSAGKPVIGVQEGGVAETVLHGRTGLLLPPSPSPADVIAAVRTMTPELALTMRTACRCRAAEYDERLFVERMRRIVAGEWLARFPE